MGHQKSCAAASNLMSNAQSAKGPLPQPCISSKSIRKRLRVRFNTAGTWARPVQTLQADLLHEKKKKKKKKAH